MERQQCFCVNMREGKGRGMLLSWLSNQNRPLQLVARRAVVAIASALCLSTASATGIPVLDVSNLAQAMLMVQNLMQQLEQTKSQYDAMTGNRGYGNILNDPTLRSYLPDQWQAVYDQVKSGGLQGISNAAQQIAKLEGLTGASTAGQQRYYDTLAANKAMTMQAYSATLSRLNNIQALMQQSNLTQDPAAKADLQNRWAAEYTMVQNEQTRLNLMSQLQQTEMHLAQEQRERESKRKFLGDAQ